MSKLEFHEYAAIFEMMDGDRFDELVADIKQKGLFVPIVLFEGKILDGRNRYLACKKAGVEPKYVEWTGPGLATDYVWSLNASRRHLVGNAVAMAAGRYAIAREGEAKERQGGKGRFGSLQNCDKPEDYGRSVTKAAEKFNVSPRTVSSATKVIKEGAPELQKAVSENKVSVSAAADIATAPIQEQVAIAAMSEKEIIEAAKDIRAKKATAKRQERIAKITEIANDNSELSTDRKYPVIYADPPWRYDYAETENRAIENQYPSMSLDDICALPVAVLATNDAALFMWTTAPKLQESFRVIEAWGFTYKTCAIWDKQKIGMGYYFRVQHEILMIATRGSLPTPLPENRPRSVLSYPYSAHSAKPHEFYDILNNMYPELPKIELFCRTPQPGWAVWGNQSAGNGDDDIPAFLKRDSA